MARITHLGSVRPAFPFAAVGRDRASVLRALSAAILLVAPLSGCETVRSVATGEVFKPDPVPTVPTRRAVATSSTPEHTAPAGAVRGGALESASINGPAPTVARSQQSAEILGQNSVNAPLAIQSGTPEPRQRRSVLGLPGAYAPSKLAEDSAPSEGAVNLSQVSFATEGGDYSPDIDRGGTFMVYASTQHRPTFDLYKKSIDGRTVTQLTNDPSDDLMPSISPDGSTVAFASNRTGNWDIFTMPIAGGAPTQITSDADEEVQPTWAPDGKRLAYSRQNGRTGAWEIWIVDATMPGVRTFLCEGFMPRWAPTESADKLLFQRARERGSRLYGIWTIDIVRGEGRNPTEVLGARSAALLQPSWSPDGGRIVYTTVNDPENGVEWPERADIWVINADGTGRTSLVRDQFRNMQPIWGNDGRVYFVSNRSGLENIWAMAAASKTSTDSEGMPDAHASAQRSSASKRVAKSKSVDHAAGSGEATNATPDFLKAEHMAGGVDE